MAADYSQFFNPSAFGSWAPKASPYMLPPGIGTAPWPAAPTQAPQAPAAPLSIMPAAAQTPGTPIGGISTAPMTAAAPQPPGGALAALFGGTTGGGTGPVLPTDQQSTPSDPAKTNDGGLAMAQMGLNMLQPKPVQGLQPIHMAQPQGMGMLRSLGGL